MAIERFGLSASGGYGSASVRVSAESAGEVRAAFFTTLGAAGDGDGQVSFALSAQWRGVARGTGGGYGEWKTAQGTVQASACAPVQQDGGWLWSCPLPPALVSDVAGGGWAFAARKYDEVEIDLSVSSEYRAAGSAMRSDEAHARCWIGYIPTYRVAGASFGLSKAALKIDVSRDWERTDDRYEIESIRQGGAELLASKPWGYVGGGSIEVPADAFGRFPTAGDADIRIRFNAPYKSIGYDLGTVAGSVAVEDESKLDEPLVRVTERVARAVTIDVGTGGVVRPADYATVRLSGSSYSFDAAESDMMNPVVLPFPPLGVEFELQTVGYGDDAVSAPVATRVAAIPFTGIMIDAVDGSAHAEIVYNPQIKYSAERVKAVAKYQGRARESSSFGFGCKSSASVSGTVRDSELPNVRAIAQAGLCLLRVGDGTRMTVAVGSVSMTRVCRGLWNVSIPCTEVV